MTIEQTERRTFEDLSDEIIISILEYLSLEEFVTIFGQLNSRLACLTFDHPWVQHHFILQSIDNQTLEKQLEFVEQLKLISRISTLRIRPFSIFNTIKQFQQLKSIENFINLRALSLHHITLDEAESIFTEENLSKLNYLTRLHLLFSFICDDNDYSPRLEHIIAIILRISTLQYCRLETTRSITFSEVQTPSTIEDLHINFSNFQSLYKLFEWTPLLKNLTAKIAIHSDSKIEQTSVPSTLQSLTIILSYPAFDDLTNLLEKLPKLQKFHLITRSIIEPMTLTSSWFQLINNSLPGLTQFKRESSVPLENIEEYMQAFHWPNRWKFAEKTTPQGTNYSRIIITNIRY